MKRRNINEYYNNKKIKITELRRLGKYDEACYMRCRCRRGGQLFKGTFEQFKEIMESKFVDNMNWKNYGKWEIDHIVPLSKGGKHDYNNIQPMWKEDNMHKHTKINYTPPKTVVEINPLLI